MLWRVGMLRDGRIALADEARSGEDRADCAASAGRVRPRTVCICWNSCSFCSCSEVCPMAATEAIAMPDDHDRESARACSSCRLPRVTVEEVSVVGIAEESRRRLAVASSCRIRAMPWTRCSTMSSAPCAHRARDRCARAHSCRDASRSGSGRPGRPAPSPTASQSRNSHRRGSAWHAVSCRQAPARRAAQFLFGRARPVARAPLVDQRTGHDDPAPASYSTSGTPFWRAIPDPASNAVILARSRSSCSIVPSSSTYSVARPGCSLLNTVALLDEAVMAAMVAARRAAP